MLRINEYSLNYTDYYVNEAVAVKLKCYIHCFAICLCIASQIVIAISITNIFIQFCIKSLRLLNHLNFASTWSQWNKSDFFFFSQLKINSCVKGLIQSIVCYVNHVFHFFSPITLCLGSSWSCWCPRTRGCPRSCCKYNCPKRQKLLETSEMSHEDLSKGRRCRNSQL